MDSTRISELACEVRKLDRKIDEIQRSLEGELRELRSEVRLHKIEALTKLQAIVAAFVVWCLVICIAATRS